MSWIESATRLEALMRRLGVRGRSWRSSRRREIEFPNLGDVLTRDPETDFEKQRRLRSAAMDVDR
jgi:hypothetical protein